jgi:flagellar basal-body rod protein FlgG
MNQVLHIAATGLRSQQAALDTVANNLANVNTLAFKKGKARFADVVALSGAANMTDIELADRSNLRTETGMGAVVTSTRKVFSQGELRKTESSLDVAVLGAGFLELLTAKGETLLWRGGAMKVSPDGFLVAGNGLSLKTPISLPRDTQEISIDEAGQVTALVKGQSVPQSIGQLELVSVFDIEQLEPVGDGMYRLSDPKTEISRGTSTEQGLGVIRQGFLETSNVQLTDELVELMILQRAYAANAKMVQVADEIMALANGLKR